MSTYAIIIGVIGLIVQGLFVHFEYKEKYALAVILKGSASILL